MTPRGRAAELTKKAETHNFNDQVRKESCMNNLSQTMLNALVNANANGQKANLDEILKEVLMEEIEKGVNEIIGHELISTVALTTKP